MMEQTLAKLLLSVFFISGIGYSNDVNSSWDPEISCMAINIYHEARDQSIAGQIAVGQVTMNRVRDKRFPDTICEVVMEGPHRPSWKGTGEMIPIRNRCQFSWYCDGKSDKIYNQKAYEEIYDISEMIVKNTLKVDITSGATHYHAYYVSPAWAKTKKRTAKIEDHIFYKWEIK